ncbi:amidohydrolase family protein [Glycocaulis profundi]|nr:amidohydrolase family protein [Glycocaulis profundi]
MIAVWLAALAAFGGAIEDEARAPDAVTAYRGVHVIDVETGVTASDRVVIVDGERIAAVLDDEAGALPPGAVIVDASGLYVIPGLVDAHVHLATPPDRPRAEASLRRQLYAGVVAVRSMADDVRQVADLARASHAGEIDAPDIHYAALVAGPGFFDDPRTIAVTRGARPGDAPWMQALDDDTDLELAVAVARGTSASGLKIYADLPARLVSGVAREARSQGMAVWAHAMVFPALPSEVASFDVDVASHACYLGYQAMEERPDLYRNRFPVDAGLFGEEAHPALAPVFERMASNGIVLDATLRVHREAERRHEMGASLVPPFCTAELAGLLTAHAAAAGVVIAAGTDGDTHPENPWPALHEELALLSDHAGMSPAQAIRAATSGGAAALGVPEDLGAVEPGRLASLVFLRENPVENLDNLSSVAFVLKRGRRHDREDYEAQRR